MKIVIELIMEIGPWQLYGKKILPNEIACLRVGYQKSYPRKLVKAVCGRWNRLKIT